MHSPRNVHVPHQVKPELNKQCTGIVLQCTSRTSIIFHNFIAYQTVAAQELEATGQDWIRKTAICCHIQRTAHLGAYGGFMLLFLFFFLLFSIYCKDTGINKTSVWNGMMIYYCHIFLSGWCSSHMDFLEFKMWPLFICVCQVSNRKYWCK